MDKENKNRGKGKRNDLQTRASKRVIYVIGLITLFISPLSLMGQYVCYDRDGYANVRKGPGVQYEIVDKVSKYEVFYSSDWLRVDGESLNTSLTWIPFARSINDTIDGFVYKKNIRNLDDMPQLRGVFVNDTLFSCSNDTISINLVVKDFDKNNHIIEDTIFNGDNEKYIKTIDGKYPIGLVFQRIDGDKIWGSEIKALYIERRNKRIYLPIDTIKSYFNPNGLCVWLGYENELYIYISVGDGGEAYGIYLSVVNGVIKYTLEWG